MRPNLNEGWAVPPGGKLAHYFRNGMCMCGAFKDHGFPLSPTVPAGAQVATRCSYLRVTTEPKPMTTDPVYESALKAAEAVKQSAITERNKVVAVLARIADALKWPVARARPNMPGIDEEWQNAVYITLPTGQVSWCYHCSDAYLFSWIPFQRTSVWDGHNTELKYIRCAQLTPELIRNSTPLATVQQTLQVAITQCRVYHGTQGFDELADLLTDALAEIS